MTLGVFNATGFRCLESVSLDPDPHRIEKFDVVVSLDGPVNAYLPEQPFRTVFLDWDVGASPENLDEAATTERYAELYREIAIRVSDLMTTLRGEEAD